MIACPECEAQVSSRAPACPRCGVKLRRGGRRGLLISGVAAGAVVLLSAGYVVWGAVSGAEQDARWGAEVDRIVAAADGAESLEVAADRSSVRMVSGELEKCSQAEELALYLELLNSYLEPFGLTVATVEFAPGGAMIARAVVLQATADVPVRCESGKRAELSDAVGRARLAAATFLGAIGSPDGTGGEIDETREIAAQTGAGPVMIRVTYGEESGLDVVISREPVGIDWGAPLRAVGF